ENPPYGMIGRIEETSASFEARSAPRSYPTEGPRLACEPQPAGAHVGAPAQLRPRSMRSGPDRRYGVSGTELVAHHVARVAGGGELRAEFVEGGPIIVGKGYDVALRPAHPWQLPKQHHRLAVADQRSKSVQSLP